MLNNGNHKKGKLGHFTTLLFGFPLLISLFVIAVEIKLLKLYPSFVRMVTDEDVKTHNTRWQNQKIYGFATFT